MKSINTTMRRLIRYCVASVMVLTLVPVLHAGELLTLYENRNESDPMADALKYQQLAAEQRVKTRKLAYLPSITVDAKELWVERSIEQDEFGVTQPGREELLNGRLSVMLDQPLYDATLGPQVAAAQALYHRRQELFNVTLEQTTQRILEKYLNATRHYSEMRSIGRVMNRLEVELEKVTKNFEVKLATVSDLETVKMNLTSMRLEQSVARQHFGAARMNLGVPSEGESWVILDPAATLPLALLEADEKGPSDLNALKLEVTSLDHEARAARRRDLPRVSIHGRYGVDDAEHYEATIPDYEGTRDLEGYEVGIAVSWALFDRGINRSEAKELTYMKMAKQAEYEARVMEWDGMKQLGMAALEQGQKRVNDAHAMMEHQATLLDAANKGYEAGTESYINALTAFLLYEASVRDWENARFDQLSQWIVLSAQSSGWTKALVEAVDPLFVASKD